MAGYTSIKVRDMDLMTQYYQEHLNAELVDDSDTTALLLLGNTMFEFVMAFNDIVPSSLTLLYEDYDDFESVVKDLGLRANVCYGQYRSSIEDIEGNLIVFSYYEMDVPKEVLVEKIG